MNIAETTIITARLQLVPLTERFEDDIFRFFTLDITAYMIPQPTGDIRDTREFIQNAITARQNGTDLEFAIILTETGEFLGCSGLHEYHTPTPELGIWLKQEAHGHQFGKEAILGIMDFAASCLNPDYFIYKADRRNIASRRIPESCGGIMADRSEIRSDTGKQLDAIEYHIPVMPCLQSSPKQN